jgi:hypothetical protein
VSSADINVPNKTTRSTKVRIKYLYNPLLKKFSKGENFYFLHNMEYNVRRSTSTEIVMNDSNAEFALIASFITLEYKY